MGVSKAVVANLLRTMHPFFQGRVQMHHTTRTFYTFSHSRLELHTTNLLEFICPLNHPKLKKQKYKNGQGLPVAEMCIFNPSCV